ncbi:MAG TPA: chemotaxis protein CheB [Ktedonobacterales bacterium]|nr:chemotaxis protein CheB [Ktedonobacterales bacterium]
MQGRDPVDELTHDIVTLGASAGGIEALTTLVCNLPRNIPAAFFVVVHIPAEAPSVLAEILDRAGPLPASIARDRAPIERGHIYVAPPDHHLLLTPVAMRLTRGPSENRHRPAIDPLFRSAALSFGPRVVGVVLSGALNDGTAGLLAIKRAGGVTMVQDPTTAAFPSMPSSALTYVPVDWCLHVPALAKQIVALAHGHQGEQAERKGAVHAVDEMDEEQEFEMRIETDIAGLNPAAIGRPPPSGRISSYTCPTCHGPLWEIQDGPLLRFRCRVGHAFTAESVVEGQDDNVEEALWLALNTLEESEQLYARLAQQAHERNHAWMGDRFSKKAQNVRERAGAIRRLLIAGPQEARRLEERDQEAQEGAAEGEAGD